MIYKKEEIYQLYKKSGIYGDFVLNDEVNDMDLIDANTIDVTQMLQKHKGFNLDGKLFLYLKKILSHELSSVSSANKKIVFFNKILNYLGEEPLSKKILLSVDKNKTFEPLLNEYDFGFSCAHTLVEPLNVLQALELNAFSCQTILMVFPNLSLSQIRPLFSFFQKLHDLKIRVRIITSKPDQEASNVAYKPLLTLKEYSNVSIKVQKNVYTMNEIIHRCIIFIRENNKSSVIIDFPQTMVQTNLPSDSQVSFVIKKEDNLNIYNAFYQDFVMRWFSGKYCLLNSKNVDHIQYNRVETESSIFDLTWKDFALKTSFKYDLYKFQKIILNKIITKQEQITRKEKAKKTSAILGFMGDNCGKTLISAYNFKHYSDKRKTIKPRILFISNRRTKLIKALNQFSIVMNDPNFGDLYLSDTKNKLTSNVFASRQHLIKNLKTWSKDHFDFVVIEGITVANYKRYQEIFDYFTPQHLLVISKNIGLSHVSFFVKNFDHKFNFIDILSPVKQGLLKKIEYYALGDLSTDFIGLNLNKATSKELYYRLTGKERFKEFKKYLDQYLIFNNKTKGLVVAYDDAHASDLVKVLNKMYKPDCAMLLPSKALGHIFDKLHEKLLMGNINFVVTTHTSLEFVSSGDFNVLINHSFDKNVGDFSKKCFAALARTGNSSPLVILDFVFPMPKSYDFIKNKYNLFINPYDAKTIVEKSVFYEDGLFLSFNKSAKEIIFKRANNLDELDSSKTFIKKQNYEDYEGFFTNNNYYLWNVYKLNNYLLVDDNKQIPWYLKPTHVVPGFFLCNSFSFLTSAYNILKNQKYDRYQDNVLLSVLSSFFTNHNAKELFAEIGQHASDSKGALIYLHKTYPKMIQELTFLIKYLLKTQINKLDLPAKILNDTKIELNSAFNVRQILALFNLETFFQLKLRIIEELHPRKLKGDRPWIIWATENQNSYNNLSTKLVSPKILFWVSPYNWSKQSPGLRKFINERQQVLIAYRDSKINKITGSNENYKIIGVKGKILEISNNKPLNIIIKIQ